MYFDGRRCARGIESQDLNISLLDTEKNAKAGGCGEQVGLGEGQD